MNPSKFNAYIDEKCFGVDQSQELCGSHPFSGMPCGVVSVEHNCPHIRDGGPWATCEHRKPYTPPDYCNDWAAFGKLWEWCEENCLGIEVTKFDNCIVTLALGNDGTANGAESDLPLALARAVYEATKGT